MHVTGTLSADDRKPIAGGRVSALLENRTLASGSTDSSGRFDLKFIVPGDLRGGQRPLTVRFAGDQQHSAAQSGVTLDMSELAAPAAPTEAPPDGNSALTLNASNPTPSNGDVVTLSGKLLSPQGLPLTNAGLSLYNGDVEIEESYMITDAEGTFTTIFEVPADQKDPVTLSVRFAGGEGYPAAEASVSLDINFHEIGSSTPSPSATPSAESSQTPSASPSASASATAAPQTTAELDNSLFSGVGAWIIGAVVIVGGLALVTVALVFSSSLRARARHSQQMAEEPEEEGTLDIFAEEESDSPTPRHGP